ncbi:hypothetical protein [Renibacterium salmoninarum]|uniref:hypothetical protein n=1 Tax=Renibacterium salmoninarum TaxID=1646 RepID=UPI0003212EBA|nr:hypothetical protein [Renibacterium salmoninarum]
MANFLAAPFGSEEYLLINYGSAGTDYVLDAKGNPQATPQAQQHTGVPWKFVAAPQQAIYSPTDKAAVDALHSAYQKLIPGASANPCANLFSSTDAAKGSVLGRRQGLCRGPAIDGRRQECGDQMEAIRWRHDPRRIPEAFD